MKRKEERREYDHDQLFKYKDYRHNVSRSSRRYPLFPTEVAAAGRAACLDLPRAGICASASYVQRRWNVNERLA